MKKIFTCFTFLVLSVAAIAQKFTQWTFEGDVSTPSLGVGTLTNLGGVTDTFATGADSSASGYNTASYPLQGTASGTAGVKFATSTAGRSGIIVSWQQRHSNTASKFVAFQYSADGGSSWITPDLTPANTSGTEQGVDYANDIYFDTTATVFMKRIIDLTSISAVNNNPAFQFRIVSVFSPDSADYAPALATSTYGTPGTLRFDNVTIGSNGLLPVKLGAFAASVKDQNTVTLNWTTYNESGFSHFEVEKATGANSNHFITIGTVTALNAVRGSSYSFTDHEVKSQWNYYRLKMVDKDGVISYSGILFIKPALKVTFLVTPNPVHFSLTISHPKAVKGAQLQIFSEEGKKLAAYSVQTGVSETGINVARFGRGTYILIYQNDGIITSTKFIKQ